MILVVETGFTFPTNKISVLVWGSSVKIPVRTKYLINPPLALSSETKACSSISCALSKRDFNSPKSKKSFCNPKYFARSLPWSYSGTSCLSVTAIIPRVSRLLNSRRTAFKCEPTARQISRTKKARSGWRKNSCKSFNLVFEPKRCSSIFLLLFSPLQLPSNISSYLAKIWTFFGLCSILLRATKVKTMEHKLQIHEFFVEGGESERSHVLLHITEPSTPEEREKGYFFAVCELNGA